MVAIDKTDLFNVAGDGLFFILILFKWRKVLKTSQAGRTFYHWQSQDYSLPGSETVSR